MGRLCRHRPPLGFPATVIAYCIGYLATAMPMPAGLGVLDTGLAAALVLYGLPPAASVGAVLVYHAISIWVPGAGGFSPGCRRPAGIDCAAAPRVEPVPVLVPEIRPLQLARAGESDS